MPPMGIDSFNRIVRHLRAVKVAGERAAGRRKPGDGVTDGELLERYRRPR